MHDIDVIVVNNATICKTNIAFSPVAMLTEQNRRLFSATHPSAAKQILRRRDRPSFLALLRSLVPIFLILFLFQSQQAATAPLPAAEKKPFRAMVIKVQDGDSLKVLRGRKELAIRLWGIDAPEWGQPHAGLAIDHLRKTLRKRSVLVEPMEIDAYGRIVAQIFVDGRNVSELLVEKGFAWVHIYYCDRRICSHWKDAQEMAQDKRMGLWRSDEAVPPWQWKKRHGRQRR